MGKKEKNQSNILPPTTSDETVIPPDPAGAFSKPEEVVSKTRVAEPLKSHKSEIPNLKSDKPASVRFSGGTWRGKASAVAEVARDNIDVAANTTSDSFQSMIRSSPPAQRLTRTLRSPSKTSSGRAPVTRLIVTSDIRDNPPDSEVVKLPESDKNLVEAEAEVMIDDQSLLVNDGSVKAETKAITDDQSLLPQDGSAETAGPDRPLPAPGWRGWWTKPVVDSEKAVDKANDTTTWTDTSKAATTSEPDGVPPNTAKAQAEPVPEASQGKPISVEKVAEISSDKNEPSEKSSEANTRQTRTSWFGFWGAGQNIATNTNLGSTLQKSEPAEPSQSTAPYVPQAFSENAKAAGEPVAPPQPSSSWAFWSRAAPDSFTASNEQSKDVNGELAVAETSSQSDPQPTFIKAGQSQPPSTTDKVKKNERPSLSLASEDSSITQKPVKNKQKLIRQEPVKASPMTLETSSGSEKTVKVIANKSLLKQASVSQNNLILPAFKDTYHLDQAPSYMQQILRVLGRGGPPGQAQLAISSSPPKIHKALSIGVHGYFPAPLIQKVLGQPTGTSIRFALGGAKAIQKWTSAQGYSCEIEKIALEGEGMITDRVDTLWKLLLNWIDKIRQADFIMIACHSQGVPVSVMLVAKLIDFGCIKPSTRLGICGMAGVNLGPFSSYQNRLFSGSASELFSFADSGSTVSKDYSSALNLALRHHVRILYVGSIDDQLVSLESSTFSNISHPYIYRAVFVDGRIHAPDFITHLVGFALKLRNLGISDHGLIRELSLPLAGSLYTGEGHSRIYDDQAVYELAVEHALETTSLSGEAPLPEIKAYEAPSSGNSNPYFLPWAMRGLLEEEFVRTELKKETKELLRLFEAWKPSSKVLKDVKFRLEAVKSKL